MSSTKQTAITADGKPYAPKADCKTHSFGGAPKHELIVDLSSLEDLPAAWSIDGEDFEAPEVEEPSYDKADFLARLKKAVSENPDVDAVTLACTNSREWPSVETWHALDGLQPAHLEITSGAMEACELWPFEDLSPPWRLKSLYISGCTDICAVDYSKPEDIARAHAPPPPPPERRPEEDENMHGPGDYGSDDAEYNSDDIDSNCGFPRTAGTGVRTPWIPPPEPRLPPSLASVEALVFKYCHGVSFVPLGGARLKSLTVIENDATAVFIRTLDDSPDLPQTLRSLTISSTNGCDSSNFDEPMFRERLARCVALERLELVISDGNTERFRYDDEEDKGMDQAPDETDPEEEEHRYLDIPRNLPASLVHLSFRGPANEKMLQDLGRWIEHAKDASWLPNLRRIAFEVDLLDKKCEAEDVKEQLRAKRAEFLEIMTAKGRGGRPADQAVEVVECRSNDELVYPVSI